LTASANTSTISSRLASGGPHTGSGFVAHLRGRRRASGQPSAVSHRLLVKPMSWSNNEAAGRPAESRLPASTLTAAEVTVVRFTADRGGGQLKATLPSVIMANAELETRCVYNMRCLRSPRGEGAEPIERPTRPRCVARYT
jgi:hypothetical protein